MFVEAPDLLAHAFRVRGVLSLSYTEQADRRI